MIYCHDAKLSKERFLELYEKFDSEKAIKKFLKTQHFGKVQGKVNFYIESEDFYEYKVPSEGLIDVYELDYIEGREIKISTLIWEYEDRYEIITRNAAFEKRKTVYKDK